MTPASCNSRGQAVTVEGADMPIVETHDARDHTPTQPLVVIEHEAALNRRDEDITYVYIASDLRGRIIYVGITHDVYVRMAGHSRNSAWYPQMRHLRTEVHRTREDAGRRERELIRLYCPPYNKDHNGRPEFSYMRRTAAAARLRELEATT